MPQTEDGGSASIRNETEPSSSNQHQRGNGSSARKRQRQIGELGSSVGSRHEGRTSINDTSSMPADGCTSPGSARRLQG